MEPVKVNAWKFNTIIQHKGYSLIMRSYATSLFGWEADNTNIHDCNNQFLC